MAVILALMIAATMYLTTSKFGRAMCAIRESEHVAAASGIDVRATKVWAFAISAVYAGVAGGMFTLFQSFVNPDVFGFGQIVLLLSMIVVGGLGSIPGVLIGVALLGLLPEIMRTTMRGLLIWQEFVYGLILILCVMFMPRGIWGLIGARREASAMTLFALRDVGVRFGGLRALNRFSMEVAARHDPRADRPERRRQVDGVQLRLALLPARPKATSCSRANRCCALPPHGIAARGIARTFQNIELCRRLTVLENVLVGMAPRMPRYFPFAPGAAAPQGAERAAVADAEALLERTGLADYRDTPAEQLDFGHQKMLDLARALAAKPKLLLLDEPAAGLRNREIAALDALLVDLARRQGITIVLVEHVMQLVMAVADRITRAQFRREDRRRPAGRRSAAIRT